MSRSAIERRLAALTPDIHAAQNEVRVLEEQILHFADSADDARLRSLVSETPLAAREHRDAARTVQALQKDKAKWEERLRSLEAEQDRLLDELLEAGS